MAPDAVRSRTRSAALAFVLAAGAPALAAAPAAAHVSFHPNVVPTGSFPTLTMRVPNESNHAYTVRVAVRLPPGFTDVTTDPEHRWHFVLKTRRLAHPVRTDTGTIDTEVREIDFVGGRIPPHEFAAFPLALAIHGKPGSVLTFKVVQFYSDGSVSRWIGPPDADEPAPTVDVSAANGPVMDVAGTEAGPPPGAGATARASAAGGNRAGGSGRAPASSGGGHGLAIAGLVLGALGLLAGGAALVAVRRRGAA